MKGKKRVHAFKNRMEHWQVVSIGLTVYDAIAMILAFFLALWFRFDCRYTMIPKEYLNFYFKFILIYAVISIFVFRKMRLYNSIWRFASYSELLRTVVATGITFVIHCVGMNVFFGKMPLSYYVFGIMIQFVLTLGVRFSYRFVLLERSRQRKAEEIAKAKKVLLIGAGKAGQMILRDIKTAKELEDIVCCIIDDNPNKWGRYIEGVPVVGGRDDILSCVERFKIEKIVVAIPSATAQEKRDILNICKETGCELKNLPGIYQFLTGEVRVSALKDVAVEDLLGRDPIKVNMQEINAFIQDKKVMVTGGGGSIGSGLCRLIAEYHPKQLIIFDIYENNAYDIMNSDGDLTKHKGIPNRLEVLKQNKYYFCDPIPGTKLYRRSFLCHNNLRFADVKIGQDLNFYLKSVALTNNIGYLNECIYIYRCSLSGISRTYKLENLLQIKSAIAEAEKYCRLKGVFDTNLKKIFTYVRLTNYVWQLKKKSHIKKNDYETLKNELFSEIKLRDNLNLRILWCCFPVIVEYLAIKYLNIVIREI